MNDVLYLLQGSSFNIDEHVAAFSHDSLGAFFCSNIASLDYDVIIKL